MLSICMAAMMSTDARIDWRALANEAQRSGPLSQVVHRCAQGAAVPLVVLLAAASGAGSAGGLDAMRYSAAVGASGQSRIVLLSRCASNSTP